MEKIDATVRARAKQLSDAIRQDRAFGHVLTVGKLKQALAELPEEENDTIIVVGNGIDAVTIRNLKYAWFSCYGMEDGTLYRLENQDGIVSTYQPAEGKDILAVVINSYL